MKTIPLTQGKYAIVDDDVFEHLSKYNWYACWNKDSKTYYAIRKATLANGKQRNVKMHREIIGVTNSKIHIDHKNHNGLDNRIDNLRACTPSQNQMNQRKRDGCSSIYKGVSWDKRENKWAVCIRINGVMKRIGSISSEIQAAEIYNKLAIENFGEFALINNIQLPPKQIIE